MSRPSLYTRHTRLADQIANAYFLPGADREDVQQEARLALWVATGTYQAGRGATFRTWAAIAIRAHLADKVKAATRNKQRVLTDAGRDTQLSLIPGPDLERTIVAREQLREIVANGNKIVRQRAAWNTAKRRQRAAA